jgi:hypothetical protein
LRFADILEAHWPDYVANAPGPIPARHWRAVEAVLSCRTPRRGGHRHHCADCGRDFFLYHSCNHRSCPTCGSLEQRQWAARQEARLLPVAYHLVTITVPDPLRRLMLRHPRELYTILFKAGSEALRDLCRNPRHLGGDIGFVAVLHTWTRRMLHHPHLHILVPAVALAPGGCSLRHPRSEDYLVPQRALAAAVRARFEALLREAHPELAASIDLGVHSQPWVVQCKHAGRGRSALRYLAAYVRKSAFSDDRLAGYDALGRVLLRYRDSADDQWRTEAIDPPELIRRWLLHVLPRGFVRTRHYGWLSPAAHKAHRRVRFLLGLGPVRAPETPGTTPTCPHCNATPVRIATVAPARGPPLSRIGIHRAL